MVKERKAQWRQDTPQQQMVALTQAIAGYAVWFVEEPEALKPENVQRVFQNINEKCEDLFELSNWMDSQWQ